VRLLPFLLLATALAVTPAPLAALDKVTLATNWKAEAEHGGFYQAIATGIYRRHGLDVTLRMGGPQVNNPQLLAAGVVDFNVGASSFAALNYVKAGVPVITVAVYQSTGSLGYALIYPIAVPAVCFVLSLFLMPETRKISIWNPESKAA